MFVLLCINFDYNYIPILSEYNENKSKLYKELKKILSYFLGNFNNEKSAFGVRKRILIDFNKKIILG